jgi:glycine hydroxymethyltransferase
VKITVNKNTVPFDPQTPFVTSGIRIGAPSVTSRGMVETDMVTIGECIADIIDNGEAAFDSVSARVKELCGRYPLYTNDVFM